MSPDSVRVQIERVNLKINPVEHKGLNQPQHRFPEESVDAKGYIALIEQAQYTASKHQRNEGIRPLDSMLNVRAREKLEFLLEEGGQVLC